MENTYHTLIVGDDATKFALEYGFEYTQNMSTARSMQEWEAWVSRGCTPSYRKGNYSCPPNYPNQTRAEINLPPLESFPDFVNNHDTIGIVGTTFLFTNNNQSLTFVYLKQLTIQV